MVRAVKVIRKDSQTLEEKILSEVSILSKIDHPNIVKIIEIFVDLRLIYIVTEYCEGCPSPRHVSNIHEGGELFDRIKAITNFSEKLTALYMHSIFSALVYCHERKIVHRDLKVMALVNE
jgi:calcium-dependent protein kinase